MVDAMCVREKSAPYDYTIEDRLEAERKTHEAALSEADRRAAALRNEEEAFVA